MSLASKAGEPKRLRPSVADAGRSSRRFQGAAGGCPPDDTRLARRRADAARGVLRRQRGLPLPRAGIRRAPLRAGRAARRRLAADRHRRRRLRALAEAVARAARARPSRSSDRGRDGRRPGGHERLLLHRHRPPPAGDGRRDRVPAGHRAGRAGDANGPQRGRPRLGSRRRLSADRRAHRGRADRGRVRLRERRPVRGLHRPRPPRRPARPDGRDRRPRRGDARRHASSSLRSVSGARRRRSSIRSPSPPPSASASPRRSSRTCSTSWRWRG